MPYKRCYWLYLPQIRRLQAEHGPDDRGVVLRGGHKVSVVSADRHRLHSVLMAVERQLSQALRVRKAPNSPQVTDSRPALPPQVGALFYALFRGGRLARRAGQGWLVGRVLYAQRGASGGNLR